MSIIINITGNIATGKTTFAKYLNTHLSLPYLSIDQYRKDYYDTTTEGEVRAQHKLCADLRLMKSVILEHSGVSRYATIYQKSFENSLTVLCVIPEDIMNENIRQRSPDHNPYIPDKWIRHPDPIENALYCVKLISELTQKSPVNYVYQYTTSNLKDITDDIQHWMQSVLSHDGAASRCD